MDTVNCRYATQLVHFLVDEISEEERARFDDHLASCSACRAEWLELQQAWEALPLDLEEVEVPADLKQEVMQAIFPEDRSEIREPAKPYDNPTGWRERWKRVAGKAVVAGLSAAVIGLVWNNLSLREQLEQAQWQAAQPAKVLQVYTLQSAQAELDKAKGNAWLIQQGKRTQLVLKLEGLAVTSGEEAYQVWLLQEGSRRNAGVFQVNEHGEGVLTFEMGETVIPFDNIGITLEPDATGTQPRGKKVLGT